MGRCEHMLSVTCCCRAVPCSDLGASVLSQTWIDLDRLLQPIMLFGEEDCLQGPIVPPSMLLWPRKRMALLWMHDAMKCIAKS